MLQAVARLREYERKRSKEATPEPFGEGGGWSAKLIFVVQRDDARRLDYDFRLERDGAWRAGPRRRAGRSSPGSAISLSTSRPPAEYATFAG